MLFCEQVKDDGAKAFMPDPGDLEDDTFLYL